VHTSSGSFRFFLLPKVDGEMLIGGTMSESGVTPEQQGVPDTTMLMAELEREVRTRRRSGELPADLERELDAAFEAVAPPGATGVGFEAALERAERAAFIDPVGPTESRLPGVSFLRRLVRKALAFYVEHVARRVSAFGVTAVRAMRLLGRRVDALEAATPFTDPRVRDIHFPLESDLDPSMWEETIESHLHGARGRVLHGDCGAGALVERLGKLGFDVYGVDPRPDAAELADETGREVRGMNVLEHLRSLPDGVLGAIVLSGVTDRVGLGDLVDLTRHAARVLCPGAPLVVISRHPAAWRRQVAPVVADLSPGHPLHPDTWIHLLVTGSFTHVQVHLGETSSLVEVIDAATDDNFRRIAAELFVPESFVVTARRTGT